MSESNFEVQIELQYPNIISLNTLSDFKLEHI